MKKTGNTALRAGAFTLIELLIVLTVSAILAVLIVNVLVNGMAAERTIQAKVFLYSEGEALMDQLTREIEQNTLDYEAYYLRNVQGETGWETLDYGFYGQAFYHPGATDASPLTGPYSSITGYKALCSDGLSYYPEDCPTETPDYADLDLDTGAHPFMDIDDFLGYTDDETTMNAFCESDDGSIDCDALEYAMTDELILINGEGDERTVILRELLNGSSTEYRLSKVELTGSDTDQDGIVDAWVCQADYPCTGSSSEVSGGTVPGEDDPTNDDDPQEDFMPITPTALNISEFSIYVAPLEDPYRAFAEEDAQILLQVTIFMTVTLSEDYNTRLLGELPTATFQRTISTNVYGEVVSYE